MNGIDIPLWCLVFANHEWSCICSKINNLTKTMNNHLHRSAVAWHLLSINDVTCPCSFSNDWSINSSHKLSERGIVIKILASYCISSYHYAWLLLLNSCMYWRTLYMLICVSQIVYLKFPSFKNINNKIYCEYHFCIGNIGRWKESRNWRTWYRRCK